MDIRLDPPDNIIRADIDLEQDPKFFQLYQLIEQTRWMVSNEGGMYMDDQQTVAWMVEQFRMLYKMQEGKVSIQFFDEVSNGK